MARGERCLPQAFEREIGLCWIVEVEQVDFPRRVEGDIGPACTIAGCGVALMYPHFADGDIHLIKAASRCIGHRNACRPWLRTAATITTAASGYKPVSSNPINQMSGLEFFLRLFIFHHLLV